MKIIRREVPIAVIDFDDHKFRFRKQIPDQLVEQVANSIKHNGLTNLIKLIRKDKSYQVVAGWVRLYAVRSLNLPTITADVYEELSEEDAYRINATDNARQELAPIEKARHAQFLKNILGYSVPQIATLLKVNERHVYDLLSILETSPEIQIKLEERKITLYQAVELSKFPDCKRLQFLTKVVENGSSVSWLKEQRKALTQHPYLNRHITRTSRIKQHAVRIPRGIPEVENHLRSMWDLVFKHSGMPSPGKCEFTLTCEAMESKPPYICKNEAEWVILEWGSQFPPRDPPLKSWEELPLEKRAGSIILCENCARLIFPDCVFHHDKVFQVLLDHIVESPT